MREVSPFTITLVRVAGGAILFAAIAFARGTFRLPAAEIPKYALYGFLGVAGNQLLFILGLQRTSVVETTIVTATIPALTLGAAALLGRERPSRAQIAGVVLAFAGIVLLVGGAAGFSRDHLVGDLLIVTNSTMYAFFLVLAREDFVRHGTFGVLPGVFVAGAVLATPVCLPAFLATPWSSLSPRAEGSLVYILVFATLGAYGLNAFALGRAKASTVAAYIYLQPAVAMTSAALALGEPIGARQVTALGLVVSGTVLATRQKTEPALPAPST